MITIRKSADRGRTKRNWLTSLHTFSFADYYDPKFISFGYLLVINDDTVKPGFGFGAHSHNDMEIISIVLEGELEHQDNKGSTLILKPGEIQRMSAGKGIVHSEMNPSKTAMLRFIQIWILPNKMGLPPSYEQKTILKKNNELILIASPHGDENVVTIQQNVNLYTAHLSLNSTVSHNFENDNRGWLQITQGAVDLNGQTLVEGDGAAITHEKSINIKGLEKAQFLLFDLKKN